MDFRDYSLKDLVNNVQTKQMSAKEITQSALDNIQKYDGELNSFCSVNPEDALLQAEHIDSLISKGERVGKLAGIPIGVKDLEDAKGFITTFGSELHANDPVAMEDSILVKRMRNQGCVILGKTNTPEFGHKGKTDNVPFGITKNPWNLEYSPGGSSGGTSAALASGMIPLGTGSDGGGSIRIPAALGGLAGIKTSQGRIPIGGDTPPGSGLLTVKGPMANTTEDNALALDATVGPHPTDIFSLEEENLNWSENLIDDLPKTAIWSPTMGFSNVDKEILSACEKAINLLADSGVEIIEKETIWEENPVDAWMVFWACACARRQQHLIGTDDFEKIDPLLRLFIEMGTSMDGASYASSIDACHKLGFQLNNFFEESPLIITPATCGHAPFLEGDGFVNGEQTPSWVDFTMGINMTRNPAGVVPISLLESGLPASLQIIGAQRQDLTVLKAMYSFEKVFEFSDRASGHE
jgi:Asp-tRNA(Asn)/Glu-tRNA(Gln) amidotransferase A subunit family amidase|tara:strand:- start:2064 stop:3464 length:1401 start_codon:yes stop_codon:yes gene_type:complete